MKSAYELALERLAQQGIEPPDEAALDDATRARIAEARRLTEAKLVEVEILHQTPSARPATPRRCASWKRSIGAIVNASTTRSRSRFELRSAD